MAQTKYTKSISSDTLNGKVSVNELTQEIQNSPIITALDYISVMGDVLDIYFKDALSAGDQTELTNAVAAHDGVQIDVPETVTLDSSEKTPIQKILQVAVNRPEGSSATRCSYDFTNKSTWYQKAIEVTGETLTANGLVYSGVNNWWIDLEHGKLYGESDITDKKRPKIYDNGTEVTTGFSIDYEAGEITFDSAPTGPVAADYWYGDSSEWLLAPDAGKVMMIEHAELNFTKDIDLNAAIAFEIWVYNPYDLPNKVKYQEIVYKNIKDIISSANLGQGFIPKCSGLENDVLVFPFNYATVKPFQSSVGAELRLTIDGDEPFPGEWGNATFYILSKDE